MCQAFYMYHFTEFFYKSYFSDLGNFGCGCLFKFSGPVQKIAIIYLQYKTKKIIEYPDKHHCTN